MNPQERALKLIEDSLNKKCNGLECKVVKNNIELRLENSKLKGEKQYKFYIDNRNDGVRHSRFVWCQRPCDTNMSLKCFTENGQVLGYMSESLAKENGLEEIDLNQFIHYFIGPIIQENYEMKKKLNDLELNRRIFKFKTRR